MATTLFRIGIMWTALQNKTVHTKEEAKTQRPSEVRWWRLSRKEGQILSEKSGL